MKNILSYKQGTPFLGKEIKEWIMYNIENETSSTKLAKNLKKYMNISNDEMYYIELSPKGTACGEIKKHHPNIIKLERNEKKEKTKIYNKEDVTEENKEQVLENIYEQYIDDIPDGLKNGFKVYGIGLLQILYYPLTDEEIKHHKELCKRQIKLMENALNDAIAIRKRENSKKGKSNEKS